MWCEWHPWAHKIFFSGIRPRETIRNDFVLRNPFENIFGIHTLYGGTRPWFALHGSGHTVDIGAHTDTHTPEHEHTHAHMVRLVLFQEFTVIRDEVHTIMYAENEKAQRVAWPGPPYVLKPCKRFARFGDGEFITRNNCHKSWRYLQQNGHKSVPFRHFTPSGRRREWMANGLWCYDGIGSQ